MRITVSTSRAAETRNYATHSIGTMAQSIVVQLGFSNYKQPGSSDFIITAAMIATSTCLMAFAQTVGRVLAHYLRTCSSSLRIVASASSRCCNRCSSSNENPLEVSPASQICEAFLNGIRSGYMFDATAPNGSTVGPP
ncbi:hypothetical protein Vafri_6171 [Volvox africanus]|uniref:Uncharacterized protein n=1 Tax=Volvox africanus TaxID=51714 RepID=A0A8J4B232_9CHLO|nr:hypothetical protein Vafri_6171 [Volvox africanus]